MKKIGIFLDEIHDQSIDDNQKFAKLGYNTGNMLFWHSLKTQLDLDVKSRWYIDHIDQLDLSEYKAFVTTDLIWIKQNQDFSYLNKTLDVLGELPLVPISIGLQCDDYDYDFKLHPETVKVLNRISERCIMGVRGNYTAEILTKHGISNFQVIGCPSMYMPVDGFKTVSNDKKDIKKVSINFETFYNKLDDKRIEFLEYGMENGFDFVEQTQAELEEKQIENPETFQKIKKWIDSNGNIFFDLDEWRDYIREHDFSIGARFHGNVLALWEGVPALFVTCDSRTKELCEFFSLPKIDISEFDAHKSIERYYNEADYTCFKIKYDKMVDDYRKFLVLNSLCSHIYLNNQQRSGFRMEYIFNSEFDLFNKKIDEVKKSFYTTNRIDLNDKNCEINIDKIEKIPNGRFYTNINNVRFDCCFSESKEKKLYVFMMGGISKNTVYLPNFQRHSFANAFKGSVLYIADPMYTIYNQHKLCTGWYYGDNENNYICYCKDIVMRISEYLSIKSSDIIIYGSSSGGYAAISLASKIENSKCIAINSQINLKIQRSWINAIEFEQITGNDLSSNDERNDLSGLIKSNLADRIILIENSRSRSDMDQVHSLCEYLNDTYDLGLNKIGKNVILWIYDALPLVGSSPHRSQEWKTLIPLINQLLNIDINDLDYYGDLYFSIGMLWSEHLRKIMLLEGQTRIIDNLMDKKVESGNDVVFKFNVSGNIKEYKWVSSKDNGVTWINEDAKGYNTSEILINNVNYLMNNILYKCYVIDSQGNKIESNPARLYVNEKSCVEKESHEFTDIVRYTNDNKKIVLYQIGHVGFFINCILHKLYYHKDNKAIFIIDKVIANSITIDNLIKIRDNLKYIGDIFFYNDRDIINKLKENENIEGIILDYFDNFLKDNNLKLNNIDEIYSVFDTYNAFGVYLSINKINFNMIDCVLNQCKNHNRYNLNKNISKLYDEIIFKHKVLSADCEFCKKIFSYDNAKYDIKESFTENSPVSLLSKLTEDDIEKLVDAYSLNNEQVENGCLLVLNSGWLAGSNGLNYPEGYIYLYKKIIDVFLDKKNVILKAHPNSDFSLEQWKKYFPDNICIQGFFPSFLIPYLKNVNIECIASTGSSGVKGLEVSQNEIPFLVFESYKLLNKLIVSLQLKKYLNIKNDKFYHYGMHNSVIWKVTDTILGEDSRSVWSKLMFEENSFTIIDNIFWNPGNYCDILHKKMLESQNNSVIIFVNSRKDYIFMDSNNSMLPYLYELRIKKEAYDTCEEDVNDEILYIFCKDKNIINQIQHFHFTKDFVNQKYKIIIEGLDKDKRINDLSIKVDYLLSKNNNI